MALSATGPAAAEEEEEQQPPAPPLPPPSPADPQTLARWYQLEALERAVRGNTVAFLETGAGKTLIAVLLLRAFAHRVRRPGSRAFAVFLVPTVVLVGQQAGVVEAHTDLRVKQFCGEMGVDFWSADTWLRELDGAEVLVMTPQILLDNLRHSFIRLQDIALLIFDECHRAKGNAPYACILKSRQAAMEATQYQYWIINDLRGVQEFYHPQLSCRPSDPLPRIFGMTASLVYSKGLNRVDYAKQILELENLMNSKVYTVDSESALSQYIPFAATRIVQYEDFIIPLELHNGITSCLDSLKGKHLAIVEGKLHGSSWRSAKQRILKLHQAFSYCVDNLGIWLAAKAAEVLSYKESCISFCGEKLDEQVEGIVRNYSEEVYNKLSDNMKNSERGHIGEDFAADLQDGLLTSKVHVLINCLLEYRHVQDLRCIVFVDRVITTIVLESLLSTIHQMSGWTVKHMAGNSSGLQSQSRRKHMEIVDLFRCGKVHLIIATQILEEGLDVPSCNLVIRFDPSATKQGDAEALFKTERYLASGRMMREESLRLASASCQPLKNTLCEEEYYRVESTGAVIRYFKPLPRFDIDKALGFCTLHLPKSSPLQTIHAEGEGSVLKQVVCLKACQELHAIGALTDSLLPEFGIPCEEEADIVVETYKHEQPDYFPEQLLDSWFSFSHLGLYHCYKISLERCFDTKTSPADIVLAVKCDMGPDFVSNSFKLWGVRGDVNVTMTYMGIIHINKEQIITATRFQATILSLLINDDHSEVSNPSKYFNEMQASIGVVYLLLPLVSGKVDWCSMKSSASPMHEAMNKHMRHCHSCKDLDLLQTEDGPFCRCMLKNSVVCTPHNSVSYAVIGFLDDLNANSPLYRSDGSIVSYKTHFKTRHGLSLTYDDQPLLAAAKLFKARNFLHKCHQKKEKDCTSKSIVELPPELCRIVMSPVATNTLWSFSFVPAIMYRIQCMLLSVNLKNQLGPRMQQFDVPALKVLWIVLNREQKGILEALTTKKAQEEFSQESLETLGDSFLKYVATQHLFRKYKRHHEGMLTKMKKNLISNSALCQLACNNNLVGYIRSEAFDPETWIIPGLYDTCGNSKIFCLSPNMYSVRNMSIKSKRIADSIEALIGAYLSAAGEKAAFLFLTSLGMDIEFHSEMEVEMKIARKYEEFINVSSLEAMLGYNFSDHSLLLEALTHGSYQTNATTSCYQRLEFLGDAVLDHLFTDCFYHQYPECTPGLLTDLRSASVNNNCYAHAAVKAGLHKHILHSSSELHRRMADCLGSFKHSFSGPSHGWEAGIGLPKVLGDVIESIAGAIYIDSKHNKEVVWRSMKRLLEPLATPGTIEYDPVKELQELCDRRCYNRSYKETHVDGVSSVVAVVQAEGTTYSATRTGYCKLVAKKLASKAVLQDLKAAT
ncbi:hypothetical protein ACP4OV_012327 [Aristida adscensionis]